MTRQARPGGEIGLGGRSVGDEVAAGELVVRGLEVDVSAPRRSAIAALADGPLSRAELATRLDAERIPTQGQATPHLLFRASIEGVLVGCGEHRYRTAPQRGDVDLGAALDELARRYLVAHAPATEADLAAWSGLPRHPLDQPEERATPDLIPPRLLPAFDPYLLGWKDRSFAVPAALAREVHPGGGMLRAVTTDDGLVTGTWSLTDPPDADVARFLAS